ncbi:MAG: hypothetical protein KGY76_02560 [Candidatus Thermoplasmatota archaeon]|nr:hypothetical protein [Candidatus Thermoplasmatota archaeon]
MKDLRRSEEAVMDYPFRLLIISIVLAIAIPSMLSALSYYRTQSAEEQLSQEVDQIASAVESVYIQGINASTVVDLDLPEETEYVEIGAPLSDSIDCRAIYHKIQDQSESSILVKHGREGIPMTSQDNITVTLTSSTKRISVVKRPVNFDIDDDGTHVNDYYVEIKKLR